MDQTVDDSAATVFPLPPTPNQAVWLGAVVPKRHARRAVTRSMLKRQIRAAAARQLLQAQGRMGTGLWVVRLRAPFDRVAFESATSDRMRELVRSELDTVLGNAARRIAG